MKGYIIYNSEEIEKNRGFIEKIINEGIKYDISFEVVPYDAYMGYEQPDIVLNRTRDYRVSRWYENKGVKVLNPAYITYIGNNKYEAVKYLTEHLTYDVKSDKWTAHTWFITSKELGQLLDDGYINRLVSNLSGSATDDAVIKSVDGHGGTEVFLLENGGADMEKRRDIIKQLSGHDCIIQERLDSDSSDIRVYILGGEIYAAVLRHGNTDFRSNHSLGGSISEYKLNESQKNYVMEFVNALGGSKTGMAGLDFILTKDGRMLFNEIEEMAGSRMLYECTDYDIVKDYVKWIAGLL